MIYTLHLRPENLMIGRRPHHPRLHRTSMLHRLFLTNRHRLFHLKKEQLRRRRLLCKSSIPHKLHLWKRNLESCPIGSRLMQVS